MRSTLLLLACGLHVHACADMSKLLCEFEAEAAGPPRDVVWCGGDALLLQWPTLLLAVGPYGDTASWPLSGDEEHLRVSRWCPAPSPDQASRSAHT